LAEHLIRVFKMLSSLIGHEAPTHH
jgi:hypothetical protein